MVTNWNCKIEQWVFAMEKSEILNGFSGIIIWYIHEKNDFAKVSKNSVIYRSENNFNNN